MKAQNQQEFKVPRTNLVGNVIKMPTRRISALSREDKLRRLITEASDQLCQVVDGNLDFVVRVSEPDDDVDKLLLLVNFVLASARRSFTSLSEAHKRLEDDIAAARTLQRKLLPKSLPRPKNLRVASRFVPASAVGGDFFDFLRYERCDLHAGVLADVSGKGAAAAIYAALTSGMIRSVAQEELKPNEMLDRLNKNLFARAPDGQFVALTYSTWNDESLMLETCGSGLPEPLLCRNGKVQSLALHGLPLGLFSDATYESIRVQCEPGDTLLFYTDGIVDATDDQGNEFGVQRLGEVLANKADSGGDAVVNAVVKKVADHSWSESHMDDQTVMALTVLDPNEQSSSLLYR